MGRKKKDNSSTPPKNRKNGTKAAKAAAVTPTAVAIDGVDTPDTAMPEVVVEPVEVSSEPVALEEPKQLTVKMSPQQYKELKLYAVGLGMSLRDTVAMIFKEYFSVLQED